MSDNSGSFGQDNNYFRRLLIFAAIIFVVYGVYFAKQFVADRDARELGQAIVYTHAALHNAIIVEHKATGAWPNSEEACINVIDALGDKIDIEPDRLVGIGTACRGNNFVITQSLDPEIIQGLGALELPEYMTIFAEQGTVITHFKIKN